jgi:transcriptional regulator with XRE-family HTH domain
MNIQEKFGNNIRALRLSAHLSQEKLALEAGIDRTYISDIEKGERKVSIATIEKLANVLGEDVYNYYKLKK